MDRWSRITEWPMTVAAVLFLIAYAVPIINPQVGPAASWACRFITWATWAMFAIDYVVRLVLSDDRKRYFLRHWLDLLIIALPLLRPLRLLRLATLLAVVNRQASSELRGRLAIYVTGGAALLAFCGSLAVLEAERKNPESNILDFGDAIWWAITTMTTVGYGDRYPTTMTGRLAAAALMIGGIAILGVVTASLASWLVEHVNAAESQQTEHLSEQIQALSQQISTMQARLDEMNSRATFDVLELGNAETRPNR